MAGGIIVEGADQMGKSTFCEKLSKKLKMQVIHYDPPKPGINFFNEYTRHLAYTNKPIIFDRNYMSELVYGPLFRGASGVTPEIKRRIENVYDINDYCLILLNRKNFVWEDREEMYTEDQMKYVRESFIKVYDTLSITKTIIDAWDDDAIERAIKFWERKNQI